VIIVDINQVILSNLLVQLGNHTNAELDENMIRHMTLNSLRMNRTKFQEFGELVIACDSGNVWRKTHFPYYKANRKKSKETSELDWNAIFNCLNKIRSELKEFFPYRVISVDTAEADDIISTLISEFGTDLNTGESILILSGDKDFVQLHRYGNIKQYDPTRKKYITTNDPDQYLIEHIIKGDAGDGVPNMLSPDNCFVIGQRQTTMSKKRLTELSEAIKKNTIETHSAYRNYLRNKQIIDLSMTPDYIREKVMIEYNEQANKKRDKLLNYFIQHKLKNLIESIGDF